MQKHCAGMTVIRGILVVNKSYSVPASYDPGGLLPEVQQAFCRMARAAQADGLMLRVYSGYRSYERQAAIYSNYCRTHGQAEADTFSARPGHSEHQTGLAIDVNDASEAFAGTPEAAWLAEHCAQFGFIIRYPQGKEAVTGFMYEPWHVRYVGRRCARLLEASGQTLEEYLGVSSVYR